MQEEMSYEAKRLERIRKSDPFYEIEVERDKMIDRKRASYGPADSMEEFKRKQFANKWGEE